MNQTEAELIGLHIGDGTLYKTNTGLVWELRGGLDEKEFYDNLIAPLVKKVLKADVIAKFRSGGKSGSYGVRISNKKHLKFFLKNGFLPGKKVDTIVIPQKMIEGSNIIIRACLRGLFATDGTIYLARINKNKEATYPMVEFASASKNLRNQMVDLLLKFDLQARIWTYFKDNCLPMYYLRLAGREKVSLFAQKIGFLNTKHQKKFDSIKQYL